MIETNFAADALSMLKRNDNNLEIEQSKITMKRTQSFGKPKQP